VKSRVRFEVGRPKSAITQSSQEILSEQDAEEKKLTPEEKLQK